MAHNYRFVSHNDGYIAWVSGQKVGFMRRELRNHPGKIGAKSPGTWRCWRLYQDGTPVATGDTRKAAARSGWEIKQKQRETAA